ncbi:MAG: hypothetical protein KKA67_16455 [Spirochaetes bacterium]|nr:hypothetical protein [Spirochaetota bacterium]MBU1082372.1 hypothetical protein [Spirochaetota bacterium]
MRKFLLVCLAWCAVGGLRAQSLDDIVAIGDERACSVAELRLMAPAIVASFPGMDGLESRLEEALGRYEPQDRLTKARAGYVVAKALRLRTSIAFVVLPIERYAFRALVLDGVFANTSSGGDVMDGIELLDFVARLGAAYGSRE